MKIYIVRHGQTEENIQKMLQGHMPGRLTDKGKEQVRNTAEYLASLINPGGELARKNVTFSRIVSSDLKRAMDSAQIIADKLGLPVIPMEILRERDWGIYTGMPLEEAHEKYRIDGKWVFPDPSAETEEGIYKRAGKALDEFKKLYADETIILVTHGQFARNLIGVRMGCSYHDVTSFTNAEVRVLSY